jgi:catechol 2,3-dioxygenase-like lactoylglutathione lyase family enzyme
MGAVTVEKLIHINQLLGDFAGANRFYREVFAAQEYMNNYHETEERDASLFVIGDTCIELFSPRTATSLLGRQLARFGVGWHSFEWKVPDLEAAKAALDQRGIRCGSYYPGAFLMTHPKDSHGMILEMCPTEMTNDPRLEAGWDPSRWRDGHPMGIKGLNCISVAVRDLDAAVRFLCDLTGGEVVYEADRPLAGGRGVGIRVADHDIELLAPGGRGGAVADYLEGVGPRLRSIVFEVQDLAVVEKHLAGHGLRTVAGDFAGATALHPADNYGVLWQFTEEPRPDHAG